jgi:pyruvate dehydrogenase E2 component (dihydrolipoamide acetyltransferase)
MAYPVIVPRESEEMELCQVIRWHVKKGERVRQGDILCEVDTGKATFDIEAVASGVLLDIFYHENEEAPLLTPLAVIGEEGEEYAQFRPQTEGVKTPDREGGDAGQVQIMQVEPDTGGDGSQKTGAQHARPAELHDLQGREPISPRARRLALRNGIPLHRIEGSGPGGAVVERDVRGWFQKLHED